MRERGGGGGRGGVINLGNLAFLLTILAIFTTGRFLVSIQITGRTTTATTTTKDQQKLKQKKGQLMTGKTKCKQISPDHSNVSPTQRWTLIQQFAKPHFGFQEEDRERGGGGEGGGGGGGKVGISIEACSNSLQKL